MAPFLGTAAAHKAARKTSMGLMRVTRSAVVGFGNAPCWIRTNDRLLRRQLLYPAELRELGWEALCQLSRSFYGGVLDIDAVMPAPRLSESQKEELVARYRQGKTAQALAASYGCSPNTVSRVLKAGIGAEELAELKKQSRSRSAAKHPEAAPQAVDAVVEIPAPGPQPEPLCSDSDEPADDEQTAGVLAIDDADDFGDDGDEENFEDGDDSVDALDLSGRQAAELIDPIPLLPGLLPSSVYMLVDKVVELQAKPLNEFPELGSLPEAEQARQALMLFTNPRQAKRQCGRSQRVIKVPDSDVLQRRSSYLVAQGITRLVVEGGLLYSLPEA